MKNVTQAINRRGRLILTAGLLLGTITAGLIMKLQAADTTPALAGAGSGLVSLKARVDRTAVLQGGDGNVRLELILTARDIEGRKVSVPTDLLVVLDRSGSMQGEKLEQGRAAIRELIRQLGAKDRFALVTYSYEAELTIALERATKQRRRVGKVSCKKSMLTGAPTCRMVWTSPTKRWVTRATSSAPPGSFSFPMASRITGTRASKGSCSEPLVSRNGSKCFQR